jgi:tartrate dehydrogenase/decarboxylase/D-malate dehydrogenase
MRDVRIAVIPGDGIGREVVPVATDLLATVTQLGGHARLVREEFPWGSDFYLREGRMMPEDGLATLRPYDAIFLGAVGDPPRVPDHVSLWGLLIAIRRGLSQVLNIRPARFLEGSPGPLRDPGGFDLVVVRENSEGEYSQVGGTLGEGSAEQAFQVSVFSRVAVERAVRHGFGLARRRRGLLTSATKSNGIFHTMPFWDRVVRETALDYPLVHVESVHLDALLARLVRDPASLDVVVASNLFGDLLTDLASALMGSIGLAPSANLNVDGTGPSMFEPVHGSAPDIAGRGIANPAGQIWSGVLTLEHLGLQAEADELFAALLAVIRAGDVTPDMGGNLTTHEVASRIRARLTARPATQGPRRRTS